MGRNLIRNAACTIIVELCRQTVNGTCRGALVLRSGVYSSVASQTLIKEIMAATDSGADGFSSTPRSGLLETDNFKPK